MPHYYTFIVNDKYYLYDTATSYFIQLEKVIYTVLDDFISGSSHIDILKKHNNIEPKKVKKAIAEINKFKKEFNILQNNPFHKFQFGITKKGLENQLQNKLSHIVLNITDNCNYNCEYCKYGSNYQYEANHSNTNMDIPTITKAIDFLLNRSKHSDKLRVGFYGGEPLLQFDKIKFAVNYILEKTAKPVSFSLTTNASRLNKNIINFFIKNEFKILLSIDGPANIHDRYRKTAGGKGTYKHIIKAIKQFKRVDPDYYNKKVGFSAVITPPFNLNSVNSFFQLEEINNKSPIFINLADYYDTDFYENFPKSIWKDFKEQKEELRQIFYKNIVDSVDNYSSVVWTLFGDKIIKLHNRPTGYNNNTLGLLGSCMPGVHVLFVNTNGDFYICERIGRHFPIGNLNSGFNIDNVYRIINDFISVLEKNGCIECPFVRICSTCFVHARENNSFSKKRFKQNCNVKKLSIKEMLVDYAFATEKSPSLLDDYSES